MLHSLFKNTTDFRQLDVSVIYYDPIHDYGFLKFDPQALKRTSVSELTLRPDLAVVGMAIRVIGNDAAQRLTISEGTISRVNRNAPEYNGYMDFNINYLQGSAMTSGGSSGSPVIDIHGNVVGLNAGGFASASIAFFLALEHPLKSLQHLLRDEQIPRGTLQARWTLQPFHECQTLGLTDDWVATIQQQLPEETGMLVVKAVLPGGPAESRIQEGDVLLKLNGKVVTRFSDMTDILDSNVHHDINVTAHRGREEVEVTMKVDDLHAITPDRYLMISTTMFHDFSYQQAQRHRIPVRDAGVYCSTDGFFGTATGGSLIKSIDGRAVRNLESFIEVIQSIPGKSLRKRLL
jgi:pro-apoptotic serine protease NMA111